LKGNFVRCLHQENIQLRFLYINSSIKLILKIFQPISKLLLSPSKVEIHLKEEPILDLKFTQHKSKISGTINCLKKCGKISIKLFDEHGEIVDEFVDTKGEYYFSDVLPSKYTGF